VDLAALVRKLYDLPVAVTNDANAAALGEMIYGAARGMKDFIVITLGTGLGSGIVAGGELVYGADGFAGEIGHTIVDPQGRECGCGGRGHLETYASATGICRTVSELLAVRRGESELRSIAPRDLTSRMIADAARRGDSIAREAFEFTGRILGMKLADSVAHLSPEAIILFGGVASAGDLIFAPTKRSLEEYLLPIFRNKVELIPSGLKEGDAAVLGASALIWHDILKQRTP
jgi:glucokinase